jgi:hypothetical protein
MTSHTNTPPILPDTQKFDGTNWSSWNRWIVTTARIRSVEKYLNGIIPKPTVSTSSPSPTAAPAATATDTPATSTEAPESTPWHSMNPSLDEWIIRDAWAMGLLLYNCTNPVGLGMASDGTAAEAWKSLKDLYGAQSTLFAVNAQRELRNTMLRDGEDLIAHLANLRTKWSAANDVGAEITDKDFIIILLASLPPSWDTIVATLYETPTSVELISKLNFHWARVGRATSTAKGGITALATNTKSSSKSQSPLQCTNPKCGRRGHIIDNCYWEGGGKEGQFPAHFRKKVVVNTPAANTSSAAPSVTAALASADQNTVTERTYTILMADASEEVIISDAALLTIPNPDPNNVLTFIDSGASDHCFVSRADFGNDYVAFDVPREGQSASKGAKFRILGQGSITKTVESPGMNSRTTLKFNSVLHTPDLTANLISVGRFDIAGFSVNFGDGRATFVDSAGTKFMAGERTGSMYRLTLADPTQAMAAKSHEKPVNLEVWHRRFGHASVSSIRALAKRGLLDGLQFVGDIDEKGTCEDCIYGKHTARPYDEKFEKEKDVLERAHVDIFVMTNTPSFGGAVYMMLITDGGSSVKHGYFLTHKSADATLQALKDYVAEAETQTGKKLKRIRVDMGREWRNDKWDEFLREKGIVMESGAPYAHGQNGVAERGIRTIIERVRCMLADSGLPKGLWAEAAATAIYLDNFIPSARHPDVIPWEVWTGKRQDVSHLRPFGCTAYAKIAPEIDQSKLLPRSIKYVMIGYFGRGAYKLYDPAKRSIIKCRDVIFEEGQGHRTPALDFDDILTEDEPGAQPAPSTSDAGVLRPSMQNVAAPRPRATDPPLHPALSEVSGLPSAHPATPAATNPTGSSLPTAPLRRSARNAKPSPALAASREYTEREAVAESGGETWAQTARALSATAEASWESQETTSQLTPANEAPAGNILDLLSDLDEHLAYMATQRDSYVPRDYKEAMERADLWQPAMDTELAILLERDVFRWVEAPPDGHIIDCKWVYANKYNADGDITKRKARVVVRGFNQIPGLEFDETYASVVRMESFRMTVAIAASRGYTIWGKDIVAAYLYAPTRFTILVRPPPGAIKPAELDPTKTYVWVLNKSLYGTMDAGHNFQHEVVGSFESLGYYRSLADPCIHSRVSDGAHTITSTYTDDIFGISSTPAAGRTASSELDTCFDTKDLGEPNYILGIEITQDKAAGTITLSQRTFFERMLEQFGMADCNPKSTPLPVGITLSESDCPSTDTDRAYMKDKPYREVLGKFNWGANGTRPDLDYGSGVLSRYQSNPGPAHWKAMLHMMAYIKGTLHYSITYHRGIPISPVTYVDASYADDFDTRRSTAGYGVWMAGGLVSWSSKRQPTVALSTTEAEYMSMTRAAQQVTWMYAFLDEVGLPQEHPFTIFGDNAPAIALTKNTKGHARAKHIDVRYHYIREHVNEGRILVEHVPSDKNLADIFTKQLPRVTHHRLCREIGLTA